MEEPDKLVEMFKTVIYAVLLALFIGHVAGIEPFNIPSGSMLPNLLVGDYLFVSKYSYGYQPLFVSLRCCTNSRSLVADRRGGRADARHGGGLPPAQRYGD